MAFINYMSPKNQECNCFYLSFHALKIFFVMLHSWTFTFENKIENNFLIKYLIVLCFSFHLNIYFEETCEISYKWAKFWIFMIFEKCLGILHVWQSFMGNPILNVPNTRKRRWTRSKLWRGPMNILNTKVTKSTMTRTN
jgi:hypothetical protein